MRDQLATQRSVHHQHRIRFGKVLNDELPQIRRDTVGVANRIPSGLTSPALWVPDTQLKPLT
jgi:hypothetical protein